MRLYRLNALEFLESKVSLTSMSLVGAIAAPALLSNAAGHDDDDGEFETDVHVLMNDPLPNPEPPPGPDPGDNPPVVYPILPPSGPSGPGS
jgi:hypothetical protein